VVSCPQKRRLPLLQCAPADALETHPRQGLPLAGGHQQHFTEFSDSAPSLDPSVGNELLVRYGYLLQRATRYSPQAWYRWVTKQSPQVSILILPSSSGNTNHLCLSHIYSNTDI
jgi:hypothetical protein